MEIDDGKIEFSKNKTLLFTQYRNYFYFCVLTAVTDAISTTYFMSLLGVILLVLACGCLMKRHTHYAAGDLADVPVVPELPESA